MRLSWAATLLLVVGLAAASLLRTAGNAQADSGECSTTSADCSVTYTYTGGEQTFTVPSGVTTLSITAYGAAGGKGADGQEWEYNIFTNTCYHAGDSPGASGGQGAVVSGDVSVTPGQTLFIEVGGAGHSPTGNGSFVTAFNGGGRGGQGEDLGAPGGCYDTSNDTLGGGGGGGGGATDVRTCSMKDARCPAPGSAQDPRLIVAAGGGGGGGGGGYANNSGHAGDPGGYPPFELYNADGVGSDGTDASSDTDTPVGGGGGGGGGYHGGLGGDIGSDGGGGWGGLGGTNLVPTGGSASLTTDPAGVTIRYKPVLTITANNQSMTYGGSVPDFTVSYDGFINGDSSSMVSGLFCDATDANGNFLDLSGTTPPGAYTIVCRDAVAPNYYAIVYRTGTLTIKPAPLDIFAIDQYMTYGGTVPPITAGYSGFVNGDTSSVVSGLTCTATDGSGNPIAITSSTPVDEYGIRCSGATAPSYYTIRYLPGTLEIVAAPLTITANNQTMTYGGTVPTFDASFSGLVNGDTSSVVSGLTCTATDGSGNPITSSTPAGAYTISCSGDTAPNYDIRYATGTLTISKAVTTTGLSADQNPAVYGQQVTFTATVGVAAPGAGSPTGTVAFQDGGSAIPGCTSQPVDTSTETATCATSALAAGSHAITAVYSGDSDFITAVYSGDSDFAGSSTASPLQQTINPAPQTISFAPLPDHLLGDPPFTVSATGGASGNPVTFAAGPSSVCASGGTNGATITLVGVGACTVTASQAGNANYLSAIPVAQSFSVAYPPLYQTLALTSSPPGPVTTGSVVTASFSLGNHTTAAQTVSVKVTLAYTGSKGSLSVTIPLTLRLSAGQTLSKSVSFTVSRLFPRGAYTLTLAAKDGSGDTATSSVSLTVS